MLTLFVFPETSSDAILLRRAKRLRNLKGGRKIYSKSEILHSKLSGSEIVWNALIKLTEIMIKDPAVLFTNIYVSGKKF